MPKIKLNLLFNIRRLVIHSVRWSGKISEPKIKPGTYIAPILPILILPIVLSACNTLSVAKDVENVNHTNDVVAVKDNAEVSTQAKSEKPADTQGASAEKPAKLDSDSLFNRCT
jgi:hypothetical protein